MVDIINNADGSVEVVEPSSPSLLSHLQQMPKEPTAPENNTPNTANPRERKSRRLGTPSLGTSRHHSPAMMMSPRGFRGDYVVCLFFG